MKRSLADCARDRSIWVGCSGNFSIESTLYPLRVHSNDVNPYTCFLGYYFTDRDERLEIKDGVFEEFSDLLGSPLDKAAFVVLLSKISTYRSCKNEFYATHYHHYLTNFREIHERQKEKIENARSNVGIDGFYSECVFSYLDRVPADGVFLSSLPTYSGGYDKMYAFVEECISWDKPSYRIFNAHENNFPEILVASGANYFIFTEGPNDVLEEKSRHIAYYEKNRQIDVYVYSNLETEKLSQRKGVTYTPTKYQMLDDSYKFGPETEITIRKIDNNEANYLRLLFIKKSLDYGKYISNPSVSYGLFADGKLFGVLCYDKGTYDVTSVYLLSDFVLTRHRRLSKLALYLARTKTMGRMLEEQMLSFVESQTTKAFTKRASSMKYRGVFEYMNEKDGLINYSAGFDIKSPKKALALWLEGHGEKDE